jgi:YebC/PmpR family DNA-binding regulatory protein
LRIQASKKAKIRKIISNCFLNFTNFTMSGHSKWHSIRHKKGANDAARGKIFTRHARLITIAARDGGGDPEMNPGLKTAIENAKAENMPNNNIERAIKKGTGEDKDAASLQEITFEGYGPLGVAVLVFTITDNRNRTVASVRSAFSKNGGNLGESGSVAWMFAQKGRIEIAGFNAKNLEDLELKLIDIGAEEINHDGDYLEIISNPADLAKIKKALVAESLNIVSARVELIPETTVKITDQQDAKKIIRLMNALEDDEDVSRVSANFDIEDSLLEELEE